ncbi:MAG: ABC transporter ATP-binding protein [Bdellovibrionaceae bacterium]|nr:ABC transporter ATP-binding protein [Pseudobdellovibrionaceae bacterium]
MSSIIEISDLRKSYPSEQGRLEVLKGVNLSVDRPQSVSIMGRSGGGKSTLVALLSGLDRKDSGVVKVLQKDLSLFSSNQLIEYRAKNIGVIFQQFHLLPHLTALENVEMALAFQGVDGARDLAEKALADVGIDQRANHFPHQLSRGECQRVAIARVLVLSPKVVIADEPTGSLDVQTGERIMELLLNLVQQRDMVLVLVTHDPELAARCDRQFILEGGTLTLSSHEV